jgi:ferric-dicitrate binding protein FerR (iron transport regulator)
LISIRHATQPATANGLSSLDARRRQIRRQRRSAVRALANGAGWAAVILLSLWLLFSGIFGFLSA